jgi:hypothetical protein
MEIVERLFGGCDVKVVDNGREYNPTGRVELLVRWLCQQMARVSGPEKVQVTFDCAGQRASVEVKERSSVA